MGLLDIFYQETNRFRDKLNSQEKEKKILKDALRKTLIKFEFLWKDQMQENVYRGERLNELLREMSGDFLNLAVEVETTLENKEIVENLREISKDFMKMANSPRTLNFIELITGEMGKSPNRINIIKEKLKN